MYPSKQERTTGRRTTTNNNIERLKDAADYLLKKPKEDIEEETKKKKKKEKAAKTYTPIQIPTAEEQMQGDVMNNCVVKTALSGVMGGGFRNRDGDIFRGV